MNSSALKSWISLAVIACVVFTGSSAFAQASGLVTVGAADPANGYPKWYKDTNGLQLAPCLVVNAADPCGLVAGAAIPRLDKPIAFPRNFPDEFFYALATARIQGIGGGTGRADLVMALEGAFGGLTGTAADGAGAQIVFARFRLRVTAGLDPNATYILTYPYGTQSFVAAPTGTINFTDDQGCGATPPTCNFSLVLANTNVGPFLQWDPAVSAPPAGFIGDPAIDHAIIGSPLGTNVFRLEGPNVGGPGVNIVETNLFSVMGKIFIRPATSTAFTSTPNPSGVGQAVTLRATVRPVPPATGVPTGTVTFNDGATSLGEVTLVNGSASLSVSTLALGSHPLSAVYSGSDDFAPSTSAVVTQTVSNAPPPPVATDSVTINLAELVRQTGELRVEGVNTRIAGGGFAASVEIHDGAAAAGACPGALIGSAAVGAADGKWRFRGITNLGPTTVCVSSAGGGIASRAVTPK